MTAREFILKAILSILIVAVAPMLASYVMAGKEPRRGGRLADDFTAPATRNPIRPKYTTRDPVKTQDPLKLIPNFSNVEPRWCGDVGAKPSRKAKIVLYGSYEGEWMSPVSLGDMDVVTTAAVIDIEPGIDPLYLVLTSYDSMVWKFEGATDRIEHVVLMRPYGNASGTVGIEPEKISFNVGSPSCARYFYEAGGIDATIARKGLGSMLGREPDFVGGKYGSYRVSFPSFEASTPSRQRDPYGTLQFTPGGLLDISADEVASESGAKMYDVLPQEFGLQQLVESGDIERMSTNNFRVAKPIPRFPAGLTGAHQVKFLISSGVPMPGGSPGHSCVVMEKDGSSFGPTCHL